MENIRLSIDGKKLEVKNGLTILEIAKENRIYIPSLCDYPGLKPYGACRLCIVEIDGVKGYPTACTTYAKDGMIITTNTEKLQKLRREIFELILSEHNRHCTTCIKNLRCELQTIASYLGIDKMSLPYIEKNYPVYNTGPFFVRDYNLCILCGRCIRVCQEIRCNNAIDFLYRGIDTVPGSAYDLILKSTKIDPSSTKNMQPGDALQNSGCEFCGTCVDLCPTGALIEKNFVSQIDKVVTTICPYCGVGCQIKVEVKNDKIVRVTPDINGPANKGQLCVKGRFGIPEFVHHQDRLTIPLIRENVVKKYLGSEIFKKYNRYKDTEFIEVPWEETLNIIKKVFSLYQGEEFALIGSAKCTNEDNYIIQKFVRVVMKSNNIDHCARLCHGPSVVGLRETLGSGAMTNSISEISNAKTILAIGTNTTATHPVIALEIKKAVSKGAKLIIINPKKIELCKFAHLWLRLKPGTDIPLLNGIAKVIVSEKLYDKHFIDEHTEGFEQFIEAINNIDLNEIEKITNVKKELIIQTARSYSTEKPATILYGMGVTQHQHGTKNVFCISNLALLTGNIGKPSTGINPLRGQNNVQGACDMGILPGFYPGYQSVNDLVVKEKFEKFYGYQLNPVPGVTLTEMFEKARSRKIKCMYIIGANPVISSPCVSFTECSLTELEFLVVQDLFFTETSKFADIILPACSSLEKEGTFTNTERRVQLFNKVIEPIGESKPDWWIVCQIAKEMNMKGFDFSSSEEIMNEITKLTPIYAGISYSRLKVQTLQWPCLNETHPGTPILHTEKFPRGKAKFVFVEFTPQPEKLPYILTTERSLYHYHTGTMIRKVSDINKIQPEENLEIHPEDAKKLNISDGEIVKVSSSKSELKVKVKITDKVPEGVVSLSFHFSETPTNILFDNTIVDPLSKMVQIKVAYVNITKL